MITHTYSIYRTKIWFFEDALLFYGCPVDISFSFWPVSGELQILHGPIEISIQIDLNLPVTQAGFWGISRLRKTTRPPILQVQKSSCPHFFNLKKVLPTTFSTSKKVLAPIFQTWKKVFGMGPYFHFNWGAGQYFWG